MITIELLLRSVHFKGGCRSTALLNLCGNTDGIKLLNDLFSNNQSLLFTITIDNLTRPVFYGDRAGITPLSKLCDSDDGVNLLSYIFH